MRAMKDKQSGGEILRCGYIGIHPACSPVADDQADIHQLIPVKISHTLNVIAYIFIQALKADP